MAKLFNKNSFGNASDLKKGLYRNSPASVSQDSLHHSLSTGSSVAFGDDVFEDAAETLLHPDAHEEGGLAMNNRALLEQQRGAIFELIGTLSKQLLTGHVNLVNVSMPVKMFEPRSYLEKLSDVWVHARMLNIAAQAEDPVHRLKWVVTWFVAGLQHVFQSWRKPFNPILGETWQASLGDGTAVFFEQISHHPPVSAFQMFGPGDSYEFQGYSQPEVQYKGNTVKTTARGKRRIKFRDGTVIEITYPKYYLRGILYTSRPRGDIGGVARFVDEKHKLCCEMEFGKVANAGDALLQRPDALSGSIFRFRSAASQKNTSIPGKRELKSRGSLSGLANALSNALSGHSSSQVEPEMMREETFASCSGNWLSHLDWDGHRFWTLAEESGDRWQASSAPLPSDSRYREDLQQLLKETPSWPAAQVAKEKLENRQRADAKLRKEGLS